MESRESHKKEIFYHLPTGTFSISMPEKMTIIVIKDFLIFIALHEVSGVISVYVHPTLKVCIQWIQYLFSWSHAKKAKSNGINAVSVHCR